MAAWFGQISQGDKMYCNDLAGSSLNPSHVELDVHIVCLSVLLRQLSIALVLLLNQHPAEEITYKTPKLIFRTSSGISSG